MPNFKKLMSNFMSLRFMSIFLGVLIFLFLAKIQIDQSLENQKLLIQIQALSQSHQLDRLQLREVLNYVEQKKIEPNFLDQIFNASERQSGVDKNILLHTAYFMLQDRDEYDPEVVQYVKSLIIKIERKTNRTVGDNSQLGQSSYIDQVLKGMRNGFYIEAGAHDGEHVSNSIFFEFNRDWTGLLIEPVPELFVELKQADRSAYILNVCIAKKTPTITKFRVLGSLSGRENNMDGHHQDRISAESNSTNQDKSQTIYVPCYSLNTIMRALGVSNVDYFSLDVEGGEYDVLQSIDFNAINITTFSVEYTSNLPTKTLIEQHMIANNYNLSRETNQDVFFVKNS